MSFSRNNREKSRGLLRPALAVFIAFLPSTTGCWDKVHYGQVEKSSQGKEGTARSGDRSPADPDETGRSLHTAQEVVAAHSKGVQIPTSDTAAGKANTLSTNDIFANVRSSLTSEPGEPVPAPTKSAPPPTNKASGAPPEEPFPSVLPDDAPLFAIDQDSNQKHHEFVLPEFDQTQTTRESDASDGSENAGAPDEPPKNGSGDSELVPNDDDQKPAPATDLAPVDLPPNSWALDADADTGESSAATESPQMATAPLPSGGQSSTLAPTSTRRAAWMLGGQLVLATLAPQGGSDAANSPTKISDVGSLAEFLDIPVPSLPKSTDPQDGAKISNAVLRPLLSLGRHVGGEIARRYDDRQHVTLFEVAFKSNLLLGLYEPDSSAVESLADAIRAGAQRVSLPNDLWHPLIEKLAERASQQDVNDALQRFHQRVDAYLSEE